MIEEKSSAKRLCSDVGCFWQNQTQRKHYTVILIFTLQTNYISKDVFWSRVHVLLECCQVRLLRDGDIAAAGSRVGVAGTRPHTNILSANIGQLLEEIQVTRQHLTWLRPFFSQWQNSTVVSAQLCRILPVVTWRLFCTSQEELSPLTANWKRRETIRVTNDCVIK